MKNLFLLLFVTVLLLLHPAEAKRKTKKYNKEHKYNSEIIHPALGENQPPFEEEDPDVLEAVDPCEGRCRSGQVCQLSEGVAMCVCIPNCPEESDPRRKVCSNLNTTWGSDCALHQMRCWCRNSDRNCAGDREKLSHLHIDYYGECRQHDQCTEDQMSDFPRRMRDWLFNIMRDSADREELSPHYLKMEREAETNLTKRWANAAVWKFCDLDTSNDRTISRHEIFPIRAPLVALEHCIAPFLDRCDADGNHRITMQEWASCLEIKEDEIEDQCDIVRDDNNEERF